MIMLVRMRVYGLSRMRVRVIVQMVRLMGMFMLVVSGFIAQFVYREDYRYYAYSVYARSFIVVFLSFLSFRSADPLFFVLILIVLVGLVPSMYVMVRETPKAEPRH